MTRKTPTQLRAEATRRSILDSTLDLLDRMEPEDISTGQIADAAGVPVGSVYRYFRDRSDVFRALAQELMDRVDEPLELLLQRDAPVEALVEEAVELLVLASSVADRRLMRLLGSSPEMMEIEARSNQRVAQSVAAVLALRNPAMKPDERLAGARVLMRAVLSAIGPIVAEEDPVQRALLRREAMRMAAAYARVLTGETSG